MLSYFAARTRVFSSHVGSRTVRTINCRSTGVVAPAASSHPVSSVSRAGLNLFHARWYAKIAKVTKKKSVLKKKATPAPVVYDEDFEDESRDLSGDLGLVDETNAMKDDKSFLQSSSQIEKSLRQSLPPELVEKAIAEHRRVYTAFQNDQLSEEELEKSGFSRRLPLDAEGNLIVPGSPSKAATPSTTSTQKSPSPSASSSPVNKPVRAASKAAAKGAKSKSSKVTSTSKTKRPQTSDEVDAQAEIMKLLDKSDLDPEVIAKLKMTMQAQNIKKKARTNLSESQEEFNAESGEPTVETFEQREARLEAEFAALRESAEEHIYEPMMHHRMEKLKESMVNKIKNADEEDLKRMAKSGIGSGRIVKLKGKKAPAAFDATVEDDSVMIVRARASIKGGKWNEALKIYTDMARTNQNSELLASFGAEALAAKQLDIAGQAAIEAFNMNPKDLQANITAARVLLAQHDPNDEQSETRLGVALQHVDRALEQHSNWPDLLGLKGSIYLARRKYKTASEYFKKSLEMFDKLHLSRQARLPILRDYAKALAGRGKYKLSLSHLNVAHQLDTEDVEIIGLIAEVHEHGFNDLEAAAPFYRLAVQVRPDDVPSLVRLGQLFSDPKYSGQNFAAARQCYERAMVLEPSPDFWFPLGWLSMHMGEISKGVTCLEKAAEMDPEPNNRWTAVVLLAENYAFDTDPETQDRSLERAIELYMFALEEKSESHVKLNLAKCFIRVNRIDDAEALLQVLKREDPSNVEMKCVLADTYYLADKLDAAMREVNAIIEQHPTELLPHFMKGKYLCELNDFEAALPHLEMAASGLVLPSMSSPEFASLKTTIEPEIKAAAEQAAKEGYRLPDAVSRKTKSGGGSEQQEELEYDVDAEEAGQNPNGYSSSTRSGRLHPDSMLNGDQADYDPQGSQPSFVPEALRLLSQCYLSTERWSDAKRVLARAADHDPENASILVALGECLYHMGQFDDAIFTFRKASVLDRTAYRPVYQLGSVYAANGQHDQAVTYFLRVLDILESKQQLQHAATDDTAAAAANAASEAGFGPQEELMDEESLTRVAHDVYTNLAVCYNHMATKDRSQQYKHQRSAKQWADKAKALGLEQEQ